MKGVWFALTLVVIYVTLLLVCSSVVYMMKESLNWIGKAAYPWDEWHSGVWFLFFFLLKVSFFFWSRSSLSSKYICRLIADGLLLPKQYYFVYLEEGHRALALLLGTQHFMYKVAIEGWQNRKTANIVDGLVSQVNSRDSGSNPALAMSQFVSVQPKIN